MQENESTKSYISHLKIMTPLAIIKGTITDPKHAYLTTKKEYLFEFPIKEIPLMLLASFYVFDMKYTHGLTNVFMFLEHYFLGLRVPKEKTKVHNFISQLAHV